MTEPVPERTARALHELGNLLAVALGRVEGLLASDTDDPAERTASLEAIRTAILRARDTVRGVPRLGVPSAAPAMADRPRVLIIDDESLMRETLAGMFSGVGYEVTTAASGEEGIELYRRHPFDSVITDARMEPGISGLVVARAIKDHDSSAHVVLLTGVEHDPHELHAAGVDRVLIKPTRRAAILDAVRRSPV